MRFPYVIAVVAVTQMGNTDCGSVIKDPGFDLWCGDSLCSWKTERGTIERVPTWNAGDSGVQFDGTDTALEQFTSFNNGDGTCVTFDLVANIDESAEVYLNVDVEGDGTLEMHERIPTSSWQPLSYAIAFPALFDGVRFEIAKKGTGTAVLANLGVTVVDQSVCAGLSALDPGPRKNGARCAGNSDCASNECDGAFFGVCTGCVPHTDNPQSTCGAGNVCDLGAPFGPNLGVPIECVPAHAGEIGVRCLTNGECASGMCETGVCSSCTDNATCPGGSSCRTAWTNGPQTCAAGVAGAACGADGDCASGHCNGAVRKECVDGRSCATNDDCPVLTDLTPGECTTVGIQGGSCE